MNAQKFLTEANKQQVCRLLGWDELQYASFQEEQGIEYVKGIVGSDEWGASHLLKSKLFWKWWINHWNNRDQEFLTYAAASPASLREVMYKSLNNAEGFEFYPHRVIMEQSYSILSKEIIKDSIRSVETV